MVEQIYTYKKCEKEFSFVFVTNPIAVQVESVDPDVHRIHYSNFPGLRTIS